MPRIPMTLLVLTLVPALVDAQAGAAARRVLVHGATDELSPGERASLVADLQRQERAFAATGAPLAAPRAIMAPNLAWPMRPREGFMPYDYQVATYFVDHDLRNPGYVQDYACGTRAYDVRGYDHGGTDYVLWPFPWRMMDRGEVAVVAAAGGTLVAKRDGEFDRNCEFRGSQTIPNAVSIRQDDGLVARYLHFRRGSVTTAPIGARIEAGDLLGIVGSSGPSSVPHLHFELNEAQGGVVDPRHGSCNAEPERWIVAQPYENPRIVTLGTHSQAPDFVDCGVAGGEPVREEPHFRDRFAPGETVHAFVAYSDHRKGDVATFKLLRPDGGVFAQWTQDLADEDLPADFYAGTAWGWNHALPIDAPVGRWKLRGEFAGRTYEHPFVVGSGPNPDQQGLAGSWANPATDAQGLLLDVQPDFLGDGVGLVFGGWFTWGGNSAHVWYTIQGEMHADAERSTMSIYATVGGHFDSGSPTTIEAVGTATLAFEDCMHASLRYVFDDGRSGTIPLVRLLANVRCARDGDAEVDTSWSSYLLSGAWADPANSGQGLLLDLNPGQGVLFGAWYTFPPQLPEQEGQRWYTLQAALPENPAELGAIGIFESRNGRFDAAAETVTTQVGTAHLLFHSCTSATLDYAFDDGINAGAGGRLDLVRIGQPPPGCNL